MQHFPKGKAVLVLVVPSLILFAFMLAFMLLVTTNTITSVSAVEANGVGVYWDSDCTDRVFSIDWGNLTPGSVKSIVVYIRNEVEEMIYLIISTTNWNPSKAYDYITLRWDYTGRRIDPDEVLQITLTLSISRYIEGISNFSFDILIVGSQNLPGDLNGDGRVTVADLKIMDLAYSGIIEEPRADLNGDGRVTVADVKILDLIYSYIMV